MLELRSIRRQFALSSIACVALLATAPLRAAVPTAPSNLAFSIVGQTVTLTWTASGNAPAFYQLQAGFAPGQTVATFNVGAGTSTQASAGPGTYYARLVAVNADGTSPPSNEIVVTITCAPSAPLNLRAMQRGSEVFLFWNRPASGTVTGYGINAGLGPGQTIASFSSPTNGMYANVAGGTYFARVFATSACGNGPATSDVQVTFPSNSGRVADPAPGTVLTMPDVRSLIQRFAAGDRPTLANSCPTGRKYEPNPWQNRLVAFLRTLDTRFGYNSKPTRTSADNNGFPVIAAGDELSFFVGAGAAEGSSDVVTIDVLFNQCNTIAGTDPEIDYRDISPEPSKWTGAGVVSGDEK